MWFNDDSVLLQECILIGNIQWLKKLATCLIVIAWLTMMSEKLSMKSSYWYKSKWFTKQCFWASSLILSHVTYFTLPSSTLYPFHQPHFASFLANIIHIMDDGVEPLQWLKTNKVFGSHYLMSKDLSIESSYSTEINPSESESSISGLLVLCWVMWPTPLFPILHSILSNNHTSSVFFANTKYTSLMMA